MGSVTAPASWQSAGLTIALAEPVPWRRVVHPLVVEERVGRVVVVVHVVVALVAAATGVRSPGGGR